MKRIAAALLSVVAALCLWSGSMAAPEDGGKTLTLLFTTDIHSNVMPHKSEIGGKVGRYGGFARLASAVKAHGAEGETLLLDSGDFSVGTMYQSYTVSDALELSTMGRIGYDAVALGNHDFEFGMDELKEELTVLGRQGGKLQVLCSNLVDAKGRAPASRAGNPLEAQGVANYTVVERNGLRIGIFALLGYEAAEYTAAAPYALADPVETAKSMVRTLREEEQADLVVLLGHCGTMPDGSFHEDADLANKVDGIDVILSGHYHAVLPEAVMVNGTAIVCAGTALEYLGKLRLQQTGEGWRVLEYTPIPLSDAFADDPEIAAYLEPYREKVDADYLRRFGVPEDQDAVIARSALSFPSGDAMSGALEDYSTGGLLTDAYLDTLGQLGVPHVDVAAVPVGTVRSGLYAGEQTVADLYNILGYGSSPIDGSSGSPVLTMYVTGRELYDICEASASLYELVPGVQILFGGLRYTMSMDRMFFNRVYAVEVLDRETGAYRPVARDDTLYHMAATYNTAQSIALVESNSFGLLSIVPKDETGAPLPAERFVDRIVTVENPDGTRVELKEWYLLYRYVKGLPQGADGLPEIPASYDQAQGYLVKTQANLPILLANPSKTARILLWAGAALLALIVLAVVLILRRRKKRKARQAEK